jgi:uncharacterized protein YndB with AHSA1/START domain
MAARSSLATEPAERVLVMTRVFDAPPSLVFQAWTRPEHLVSWWGPEGFTLPACTMDFRPGGAYRLCMRSSEGRDYWLRGVYREIVEPERIVFTWAHENAERQIVHETVVTVTFAEHQGKTKLTLHQAVFESVAERDAHQGGWTGCLQRLAEFVAEGKE